MLPLPDEPAGTQPVRNARGLATARRIEAAAVRLGVEKGLDGLTVDAVCAEAGVGQRTFFHHFPTKEDAFLGLDLPELDEERVRAYLSDPTVGLLSGAVGLVRLPEPPDEAVAVARLQMVATSPALFRRQGERLMPLLDQVRQVVLTRLRASARRRERRHAAGAGRARHHPRRGAHAGRRHPRRAGRRAPLAGRAGDLLDALRPLWPRLL